MSRSASTGLLIIACATCLIAGEPAATSPAVGEPIQVTTGSSLDTPAWLPLQRCLIFTDLKRKKLHRLDPPDQVSEVREGASRGKAGPDGRFYGVFGTAICSWLPGEEPREILAKAAGDREISLNDLALSPKGDRLYFTTLKDPDKGRVSVVDIAAKSVRVLFDGAEEKGLANPNGIVVSPDGKWLYVVISSYKDGARSGIYRFPIQDDGGIDVAAGKAKAWANPGGLDGLAVDRAGNVYANGGLGVEVLSPAGASINRIRMPGGTNLCLGGDDQRTLYVTTASALFSVRLAGN